MAATWKITQIAQRPDGEGYFDTERLANAEFGKQAWQSNAKMFTQLVMDVLDKKINPDTGQRFGDYSTGSQIDVMLDIFHYK